MTCHCRNVTAVMSLGSSGMRREAHARFLVGNPPRGRHLRFSDWISSQLLNCGRKRVI